MYPAPTQVELPRPPFYYERRTSQTSNENAHAYNHARAPIELPRPSESRPQMASSFSDYSNAQRRPEGPFGVAKAPADSRYQGQSLPGLRDLLNPSPSSASQQSYSGPSWNPPPPPPPPPPPHNAPPGPPAYQQSHEGYYSHHQQPSHPSLSHQASSDSNPRASVHQSQRPFEVPILETSPVSARQPHPTSVPASPYYGYPDSARGYMGARPERQHHGPAASYYRKGVHSPYAPSVSDEAHYHHTPTAFGRKVNPAGTPASAESKTKYLGVKESTDGAYHVYEGGYRIPTHVDGEQVNPAWGLTKANKPRKRLALACLDCREKKIKCEPGEKSCLQCEKAKRVCRRAPPQPSQSDTASGSWSNSGNSPVQRIDSSTAPTPIATHDSDPEAVNKRRPREDCSPSDVPKKKPRSASPVPYARESGFASTEAPARIGLGIPALTGVPETAGKAPVSWDEDPYFVDAEVTLHLLNVYFAHVNSASYCLFPQRHFVHWVRGSTMKGKKERMVLYAMLALASNFADPSLKGFGRQCAVIAENAMASQLGKFDLFLVQCRMLLSLYHSTQGSDGPMCDLLGSAIRAALHLQLNTEEACLSKPRDGAPAFGFSEEQEVECRRRTFWSIFLMDRFSAATTCAIKSQDIFVRLPCADEMFERGMASSAPIFGSDVSDPASTSLSSTSPVSPLAWVAIVAAICGDVKDFVFRAIRMPPNTYRNTYEPFYTQTHEILQAWAAKLPTQLQYSESNLATAIQQNHAAPFILLHTLHHHTLMTLNRHLRHTILPDSIPGNIRAAHYHAQQILHLTTALQSAKRDICIPTSPTTPAPPAAFKLPTPFLGHAVLAAIDIVGAGGLDSNIASTLDAITGGLGALRELAPFWPSAVAQSRACEKRFYQIKNVLTNPGRARSGCWLGRRWGIEVSMADEGGEGLRAEEDCIYGLGSSKEAMGRYFDAFKEEGEGVVG